MIKAIIIEDEQLIAERLKKMVESIETQIEIVAMIGSVKDAISYLNENKPDLIFLDVNLSDSYCFKIFEEVNVSSPIIFVTAYSEYAIKAFEVNSIDYLLKPITINNLKRSIDKFKNWEKIPDYKQLASNFEIKFKKRFLIKLNNQLQSVNIVDVAYFFSEDKITFICLNNGKKLPTEHSLKRIEEEINPSDYFRVNKKFFEVFR